MIFGILLIVAPGEKKQIRAWMSDLTADYSDEKLEIREASTKSQLLSFLSEADLLDLAVVDVTLPGALEGARQVRSRFSGAEILVVADTSVSPMEYMHPSIRASALLLRPVSERWEPSIRDFFTPILLRKHPDAGEGILRVENRDGIFRIPFSRICYLEAREKKVFIRTPTEEYGVNEALERLAAQLPDNFLRCHRSYIVNRDWVYRIRLPENLLYLRNDMQVPISRGCRAAMREAFQNE